MSGLQKPKASSVDQLPIDAQGTVKALEFGTYGTLASGALAAVAAAGAMPVLLVGAIPLVGGVGSAAFGYFSGRHAHRHGGRDGQDKRTSI